MGLFWLTRPDDIDYTFDVTISGHHSGHQSLIFANDSEIDNNNCKKHKYWVYWHKHTSSTAFHENQESPYQGNIWIKDLTDEDCFDQSVRLKPVVCHEITISRIFLKEGLQIQPSEYEADYKPENRCDGKHVPANNLKNPQNPNQLTFSINNVAYSLTKTNTESIRPDCKRIKYRLYQGVWGYFKDDLADLQKKYKYIKLVDVKDLSDKDCFDRDRDKTKPFDCYGATISGLSLNNNSAEATYSLNDFCDGRHIFQQNPDIYPDNPQTIKKDRYTLVKTNRIKNTTPTCESIKYSVYKTVWGEAQGWDNIPSDQKYEGAIFIYNLKDRDCLGAWLGDHTTEEEFNCHEFSVELIGRPSSTTNYFPINYTSKLDSDKEGCSSDKGLADQSKTIETEFILPEEDDKSLNSLPHDNSTPTREDQTRSGSSGRSSPATAINCEGDSSLDFVKCAVADTSPGEKPKTSVSDLLETVVRVISYIIGFAAVIDVDGTGTKNDIF